MSVKLCWLILVAGCSPVVNGSSGAYLPALGPSPLRFRAPPVLVTATVTLPPLRMTDPVPQIATNPAESVSTNLPPADWSEFLESIWPLTALTNVTGPPLTGPTVSVMPTAQPTVVTPQMLIDFFRNAGAGTNPPPAAAVGVFTPPAPASSATYRSN